MVKKLMLAVAMVALVAAPSFAAVQNVKVGGSLVTTSVIRNDFQGTSSQQNEILSQVGLNVAADLTDNVSTNVGLVNERVWGSYSAGTAVSNVDVDTAYVTMKELLYAPLTLTVGRQKLAYGNQFIIGDGDGTSQVGTTIAALGDLTGGVNFDAIKAVLAYEPLTIDLFAARVSNNGVLAQTTTAAQDNQNLFGVNANYKMGDKMSSVVEGYVFVDQNDTATDFTPADISQKSVTTYTPGLRLSTNPIEGLNVQLEGAYQLGHFYTTEMQTRSNAFALQGLVNYALPVMKDMKPVLSAGYTYRSGNSADSNKKAFSSAYANQNVGTIYHALGYDGQNVAQNGSQLGSLGLSVSPMKDVTTKITGTGVWLANGENSSPTSRASRYVGTEADLDVTYAYTEDVKFGVSAGAFMTGKAIQTPLNNKNSTQLLSSVSVLF